VQWRSRKRQDKGSRRRLGMEVAGELERERLDRLKAWL
jgi:hypothetical protein